MDNEIESIWFVKTQREEGMGTKGRMNDMGIRRYSKSSGLGNDGAE
jgi:hypothetical protein